jgi:hypothetical protein
MHPHPKTGRQPLIAGNNQLEPPGPADARQRDPKLDPGWVSVMAQHHTA